MRDPWADETEGPRPFAIGYRKGTGEGLVYGGLFVAGLGGVAVATGSGPAFLVLIAAGLLATFHYYPLVEAGRPKLGANAGGLFIEGIGFIDWAEIADLELYRTSVRSIVLSNLIVTLTRPLEDAVVKREAQPVWRMLMARCYTRKTPTRIEVPLHTMQGDAEEILALLRAYRPAR
ncbi:hypothetical protein [Breoghania sp. L-A4]|uniref:hypothetical protein n=1 Tax=Breoghania sp. L-A4 TaxID=2304600 RepID=UPI0013C2BFAD|nr:hypothetical protein [Breoghania sp. L-A4]